MKIGVIGAGAIGGYCGVRLVQAGYDVTFVDVDESLELIQKNGFFLESFMKSVHLPEVKATADYSKLESADFVIISVKSFNTRKVAEQLKPFLNQNAFVLSFQNGVENEDILSEVLGKDRVLGTVVYVSCNSPKSGILNHTAMNKLCIGELDRTISERLKSLQQVFEKAGFEVVLSPDIKKQLWTKLMMNVSFNGMTAVMKGTLKHYRQVPEAQECYLAALKEVQAVASKEGFDISDEAVEASFNFTKTDEFADSKSSTLSDLESGRPIEIDDLHGAVLRAAKRHGIDVPYTKLLYSLIKMSSL